MNNVDMSDRILVSEPEADVETVIEQQNAVGQMDAPAGDEESKENLRAKLRNTLSKKQSLPGTLRPDVGGFPLCALPWLKGFIGLVLTDVGIRPRKRGRSTELSELTATVRSLASYLRTRPRVVYELYHL